MFGMFGIPVVSNVAIETTINGDGIKSTFPINHNLGSRRLLVQVIRAFGNFAIVQVEVQYTSLNQINIAFSSLAKPQIGENYNVIIKQV